MVPKANLKRNFKKALKQPGYAFRTFLKRFRIYLYYKFSAGRSAPPEAITLFLTHMCNLRCKMCGQWGEHGITKTFPQEVINQQIPFSKMKELIDEVSAFNPSITLFGGEPLLYRDFRQLIFYLKKKGLHTIIITNGSLLKLYAKDIVSYGIDELNISLDGPQEVHDEIRGIPGLFNRIRDNIAALNYYKKIHKTKTPLLNIEFTITKYNLGYMLDMVKVAKDFRASSLSYHHLIFLNQKIYNQQEEVFSSLFGVSSREWAGFVVDETGVDTGKLVRNIRKIKKVSAPFNINIYPNIKEEDIPLYYADPNFIPSGYKRRCLSPWICCYIFPDGGVRPCLNMELSLGDVNKSSFLEIWNNPAYINYRHILKQRKIFPACVRCTELFRY